MISRPTTTRILEDCCRTLLEDIIPAVAPGPAQVQLAMLEGVLRNMAVRAAHEIAWMEEERQAVTAYARTVASETGDHRVQAALAATSEPSSLHLDDVVDAYERASEVLSCAVEASLDGGRPDLAEAGTALLGKRLTAERQILAGWGELAGR